METAARQIIWGLRLDLHFLSGKALLTLNLPLRNLLVHSWKSSFHILITVLLVVSDTEFVGLDLPPPLLRLVEVLVNHRVADGFPARRVVKHDCPEVTLFLAYVIGHRQRLKIRVNVYHLPVLVF